MFCVDWVYLWFFILKDSWCFILGVSIYLQFQLDKNAQPSCHLFFFFFQNKMANEKNDQSFFSVFSLKIPIIVQVASKLTAPSSTSDPLDPATPLHQTSPTASSGTAIRTSFDFAFLDIVKIALRIPDLVLPAVVLDSLPRNLFSLRQIEKGARSLARQGMVDDEEDGQDMTAGDGHRFPKSKRAAQIRAWDFDWLVLTIIQNVFPVPFRLHHRL